LCTFVSFVVHALTLLLPSSSIHEPFDAVPEMYNVEVYKQSD